MYLSPLHIIKGIAEKDFEINPVNLLRLRKQLLADLNFSESITITISEKAYTKDEIIKTIDILLNNTDLEIHNFIFNNESLLAYLENENTSFSLEELNQLTIPNNIQPQLIDILKRRFIIQFKKGVNKRDFEMAKEAAFLIEKLPEEIQMKCFDNICKILIILSKDIRELENLMRKYNLNSLEKYKVGDIVKQLFFLTDDAFINFLNVFPADFDNIVSKVIESFDRITWAYFMHVYYSADRNEQGEALIFSLSNMLLKLKLRNQKQYDKLKKNCEEIYSRRPDWHIKMHQKLQSNI